MRQIRCASMALAGLAWTLTCPIGSANAADQDGFTNVARELNAAPMLPGQFIDPDGSAVISAAPTRFAGIPTATAVAQAQQFLAAEVAAAETARGSTAFGAPPPTGSGFGGTLVSRTAHSVERQRDPIARTIPLPHAAGLSFAGLVLIGLVRRRRIDAIG